MKNRFCYKLSRSIFLIIIFIAYGFTNNKGFSIGYDSTYTLSIKQKFAISENVINGDYVGLWKKTITWRSGNSISYVIKTNFNSAFSIDRNSGLITITDAKKINGKISNQDTIINLIVRTTDPQLGFEDDTCEIRVKETKYSVFIDYYSSTSGDGNRLQPLNNLQDIKPGYGYFIKRGNIIKNKFYDIQGTMANIHHPTILSVYSSGDNPIFDGSNYQNGIEAFDFKNSPYSSRYFYIYNIDVQNYPSMAFRISTGSSNFGIYNCNFKKNMLTEYNHDLGDIYFFGSAADTLINWNHELINLNSNGSWGPIVKTDASGVSAYNIRSETANTLPDKGYNFRFSISYNSSLSHFLFINGERSLQTRYPNVKIIDGIITGSADAGIFLVTDKRYSGKPYNLNIKNVLFRNNEYGIYAYNIDINNTKIESCLFDSNNKDGIHFRNGGTNHIIRYCSFINNREDGLELAKTPVQSTNLLIERNLFVGNKGKSINASNSYCASTLKIYNNTIIGVVDISGSSDVILKNNLYSSIIGNGNFSNNVVLDTLSISEYFMNPQKHDFRLTPTAISRIKESKPAKMINQPNTKEIYSIGAFNLVDD